MFSEKSFNFRFILTVVHILSANFTPFTLLYFTKEIGRLVTQEREIKPAKMDENHTLMAKTKGRWQNLKEFEFQRKKTAGLMPVTTANATGKPVMEQRYSGTAGQMQGCAASHTGSQQRHKTLTEWTL